MKRLGINKKYLFCWIVYATLGLIEAEKAAETDVRGFWFG